MHFQGHPEYSARTLLKEYRRDIKEIFAARERNLSHDAAGILRRRGGSSFCRIFERMSKRIRARSCWQSFLRLRWPSAVRGTLASCRPHRVYRNWLQYLLSRKAEAADAFDDDSGCTRVISCGRDIATRDLFTFHSCPSAALRSCNTLMLLRIRSLTPARSAAHPMELARASTTNWYDKRP